MQVKKVAAVARKHRWLTNHSSLPSGLSSENSSFPKTQLLNVTFPARASKKAPFGVLLLVVLFGKKSIVKRKKKIPVFPLTAEGSRRLWLWLVWWWRRGGGAGADAALPSCGMWCWSHSLCSDSPPGCSGMFAPCMRFSPWFWKQTGRDTNVADHKKLAPDKFHLWSSRLLNRGKTTYRMKRSSFF